MRARPEGFFRAPVAKIFEDFACLTIAFHQLCALYETDIYLNRTNWARNGRGVDWL